MSLGGGQPKTQTVTTTEKADPWAGQQPYLMDIFRQAQGQFNAPGPSYFPNSTVIPFSPQTQQALGLIQGRALQGSPVSDNAQGLAASTLSGDFLNSNPWLDATYDKASRGLMSGINATFGEGGRTGSGAHADSLGTGLADLATGIYGGNYQQERGRQMQALGLSPLISGMDYTDFDRLLGVGSAIEGKAGENLADQMARFDFSQNQPAQKLQNYANLVMGGNFGGQSTGSQTSPLYGGNPLTGALGGGLAGAGISSALGLAGPAGWGLAGLGGLLGLFGS